MKRSNATSHLALLLGSAAVLPGLAPGPVLAAEAAPGASFVAPQGPMVLVRTLRRPLPDGKEVVSRRSYDVRFASEGQGYVIEGRLLEVAVEAPEALRMLADVERARPDSSMFPIRLDRAGRLLVSAALPDNAALQKAIELALGELSTSRMVALDMLEAQAFVQQIRRRSGFSQWPEDLFRPAPGRQQISRDLALPGGVTGRIVIETEASTQGKTGLLGIYKRTVTTDLGGDVRKTFEEWSLVAPTKS